MHPIYFSFIFTILIVASGCQSNTVSLKEAQEITAEFSGTGFTPPPRTINDLLIKLAMPQINPEENLALSCNGKEKDGHWIRTFKEYLTRYNPADRIDTESDPIGPFHIDYGWKLYRGISVLEIRRGNLENAERAQTKYLSLIPETSKGARIPGYAHLAIIQISRGDLSKAAASILEAKYWENKLKRRKAHYIKIHTAWLANAEGTLAKARGQLKTAEKLFRKSIDNFIQFDEQLTMIAVVRSKLAEVIAAQGRLLEAENEARMALAHMIQYNRIGRISSAPVIFGFAKILIDQGRIKEAQKLAASAVWIYQVKCSPVNSIKFADARRILAETYALHGDYDKTLSIYNAIKASLGAQSPEYKYRFDHDLTLSYTLMDQGMLQQAISRLSRTVNQLNQSHGHNHPLNAEAKGFLALAQWKAGEKVQAEKHFFEAISILQDPMQRTGVRPHNLRLIIETYLDIMSDKVQNDWDKANELFLLSAVLRGSTVQESISAMGARAAVKTPELASLLRKEQNTRATISALESTLSNAIANKVSTTKLKKDIEQLRKAQVALLDEITNNFPDYAELLHPSPLSLKNVQALLTPDEAFIATYTSKNKTYIWTISKDKAVHFSISSLGSATLQQKVDTLRYAFSPTGNSLASIPAFDVNASYDLFFEFFEPSQHIWKSKPTLFVVAHGPLGHLPIAVLSTKKIILAAESAPLFSRYKEVPFLAKTHAIANLPSASALKTLRSIKIPLTPREPLVAFGDPFFNKEQAIAATKRSDTIEVATRGVIAFRATPQLTEASTTNISILPRLPETAEELKEIASALGVNTAGNLYLGMQANESLVKSIDLTQFRIVVFATHGLVPGDLDGLTQPALALSSPDVSTTQGDGLLTMDEIMNLNLNADWVILSACNTGSSDSAGAEAVSGLGRAFFYAGARSLLVSNWPVESNSARKLTTGLFNSEHSSKSRAEALQQSMIKVIDQGVYKNPISGKVIYSYAHPIFWAPFTLIGDTI